VAAEAIKERSLPNLRKEALQEKQGVLPYSSSAAQRSQSQVSAGAQKEGGRVNASTPQFEMFDKTITERFWSFDKANPHIYRRIVQLARKAKMRGLNRYSIDGIFHVMRWEIAIRTKGDEKHRLNDHFTALYARLVDSREPDLKGFFETRKRRSK
jgi:hypothetical protein